MRLQHLFVGLAFALAGGCAGDVTHSDPGREHPASPSAAEAPAQPPSKTLAVDAAATPSSEERGVVPPEVAKPATTPAGMMVYACPMHADVTSANPNDNCPKCGMKINKPLKPTSPTGTKPAGGAPVQQHQHDHGGGNK